MEYEWDSNKNQTNIEQHGLDFASISDFEWEAAEIIKDNRFNYGECRYQATGYANNRLTVVIYTERGDVTRLIFWRKANDREIRRYQTQTED